MIYVNDLFLIEGNRSFMFAGKKFEILKRRKNYAFKKCKRFQRDYCSE